jgi:hypothetical protein
MARVGELVARRSSDAFVGRSAEMAVLLGCLEPGGPLVLHLHGIGGIGKSALLDAFCHRARARHATVVRVDCRSVEPTERGVLQELYSAVGASAPTVPKLASRLGRIGERVVMALDTYEVFRLMDTWLRQVLVPALPDNVRVIIAGREVPVAAWQATPGWEELFRSLRLGPLAERESVDLLHGLGVDTADAQRVNRFARGHPLSLHLAASALRERPDLHLDEGTIPWVVEELTKTYLADVDDPLTRQALDAASVVRRTTQSVLHAMLPSVAPQDAFERLRALPFVERRRDGLIVHDTVKRAIATLVQTSDPARLRAYRRAAWQHFRAELRTAAGSDLWRTTADVMYLIANPVFREAFFPEEKETHHDAVEPARADDAPAILEIARRHDGPRAAAVLEVWLDRLPRSFSVVRGADGTVRGFYCMAEVDRVTPRILETDPLARAWTDHLRQHPVARDERVLFLRRWLSAEHGEQPSAEQAASWLDCKRTYLELRPHLRRIVFAVRDLPRWAPVATELGFRPLDFTIDLDAARYYSAVLDFGPASVDGWLTRLLAAELGVADAATLDDESREVAIGARRIALSEREFDVLRYLWDHECRVVERAELLEEVWDGDYDGGSNVVDVVVRGLRKKLADHASMIETLRGRGYRFRNLQ